MRGWNTETMRGLCQRQAKSCTTVSRLDFKRVKGLGGVMEDQSMLEAVEWEPYFLRQALVHFFTHPNCLHELALALSKTGRVLGEKRMSHVRFCGKTIY